MEETRFVAGISDIPGYLNVLNRMRNLCSRREYCSADILKKAADALSKYQEDNSLADKGASMIVDSLISDKYVDDSRYASAFAREKSSIAGWGLVKIRYALTLKGINKALIDKAFEEIDVSAADVRLKKLLENRYRSLKDDPQYRLKLIRFALGRGYRYDDVLKVISDIERMED